MLLLGCGGSEPPPVVAAVATPVTATTVTAVTVTAATPMTATAVSASARCANGVPNAACTAPGLRV